MKFRKFELEPSHIPSPEDYASEVKTANRLLELCEASQFYASITPLSKYGRITPWVCFQLGCAAEAQADVDVKKAFRIATIAVTAAVEVKDMSRLYANLLTLANITLRIGNIEEAKSLYLKILELPFPGGKNEKAAARVSLGSICEQKGMTSDALYYYERGLNYLRNIISVELYKDFLKQLSELYKEKQDIAGMAHCVAQLKLGDAEMVLRESINEQWDVDLILSLVTRLHSFEEHGLAEVAHEVWQRGKESKKCQEV